jgi:hypothetical protein
MVDDVEHDVVGYPTGPVRDAPRGACGARHEIATPVRAHGFGWPSPTSPLASRFAQSVLLQADEVIE